MKTKLCLLAAALLTAGSALAEPTPTINQYTKYYIDPASVRLSLDQPVAQTKIENKRLTYTGVFVEAVTTKNFWQLLNPLAPANANRDANFDRDIITGKPVGIKFFSINF